MEKTNNAWVHVENKQGYHMNFNLETSTEYELKVFANTALIDFEEEIKEKIGDDIKVEVFDLNNDNAKYLVYDFSDNIYSSPRLKSFIEAKDKVLAVNSFDDENVDSFEILDENKEPAFLICRGWQGFVR